MRGGEKRDYGSYRVDGGFSREEMNILCDALMWHERDRTQNYAEREWTHLAAGGTVDDGDIVRIRRHLKAIRDLRGRFVWVR